MGCWLAGRLMKELGLVSCQQPTHRYKRGGHEHVAILK
ncbi:putative transposase [Escherichia coli BCE006_MS-23]|nr:putative transposase [Escherichia coli MP021566.1]END56149.1 putative transposase [Escherichia coli BCE006_MS-23]END90803.1 putative transposase [Escherichia coli P0301904.3]